MWHMCLCGYAPASLPSGQFILWIYLKPNYFYSFMDQNVTLLPSSVDDDPWPPSVLSSLGKSCGLWENSNWVFSQSASVPHFPCTSIHSFHSPTPDLFAFVFSHSALQYMLRKNIAGLLRSNQKGKWEPAKARDWNKNLDEKIYR